MRPSAVQWMLLGTVALLGACGEERICTRDLHVAIRVHVTSPAGLPIDQVTAEQSQEIECEFSSAADDAGSDRMYRCHEQGGGGYTVRVYSDDDVWSTAVQIDANECHTTQIKDVDVVLDPDDANVDDVDPDSGERGDEAHGR